MSTSAFWPACCETNPKKAEELVAKMFPMSPEDQVVIVRAIAYSNLPEWKALMLRFAERMPARQGLIDRFVHDKMPTLKQIRLGLWGGAARACFVGQILCHRLLRTRHAHGFDPRMVEGPE